ncbi:MAG: DNA-binding protein [Pseudomonadota bacterium]
MSDFDDLAAPARRALAGAGIKSLAALARHSEAKIAALHGMGPNAIARLRTKLKTAGKTFRKG